MMIRSVWTMMIAQQTPGQILYPSTVYLDAHHNLFISATTPPHPACNNAHPPHNFMETMFHKLASQLVQQWMEN